MYQSYKIKTNSQITSKLGGQALNLVSIPVGRWLSCQEELEQELNEDTVLQEKLNEMVQSNLSRNELPPAYAIALLYAKDVARAKVKAREKVEKTIETNEQAKEIVKREVIKTVEPKKEQIKPKVVIKENIIITQLG